jgi:large subunit ribosomal protein L6
MSRLGKKPIEILEGVEVKEKDGIVTVKGPLGEISRDFKDFVKIEIEAKEIKLFPLGKSKKYTALWGTYASHLKNMIEGVKNGFSKTLIIEGVGFKVKLEGKTLVLNLGFSHQVKVEVPEGIEVLVEKNSIKISGVNKELVGYFAAKVRDFKKPEPYKGKGIRYKDEVIRRKAGKKAAGTVV